MTRHLTLFLQEIDILLSSSLPSALLPGLPMVFLTRENHVVSPHVLSSAGPFHEQVTKVFWADQIEKIKGAFEDTKAFGPAAAEEWVKGLEAQGKRSVADAVRWEKWYLVGGVHDMRKLNPGPFPHTDSNSHDSRSAYSPDFGNPVATVNGSSHAKHKERVLNRERFVVDPRSGVISVVQDQPGLHVDSVAATSTDYANSSSSPMRLMTEQTDTLKALRRAEIERWAYTLQPPIPPNVLARLPAFLAAIQLTTPFDDDAWQLLKRRLLEQQNEGRRLDRESRADSQPFVEVLTRQDDDGPRVNGAVTDADWNEVQGPVRAQISAFADEIIKQEWKGGQKVTKKNAPQFAADVLLYVRKKFYAKIAKDIEEARASGESLTTEPSEGPWTRKLTIENMKWVFDCKIKPHTGNLRRELFLCGSCKGSVKFYVFEGVVQHYAAKHTDALSLGNTIVYWRAEWPKKPIFQPDLQKRLHPHSKSKSKTLDDYVSLTSQPTPASDHGEQAATQPSAECGNRAPAAEMGVSTQYGPNGLPGISQHESCPRSGHLYGRSGYPPHSRFPHYEQPPPRVEPYSEKSYNVPETSQITGYGPSVLSPEEEAGARAKDHKSRQLEQTLAIAKQTWQSIMNVKSLENSVRVCVVIYHTAMSFQEMFCEALPLGLFLKAITNTTNNALRLDHVAGLACKACKLGAHPVLQSKTYSLAKLLKHFNANHSENAAPPVEKPLDWRVDMIWLPEISTLMTLRERIGNNKEAFNVIFNTLPWAFETPNRPEASFIHDLTQVSTPQWQQPSIVANDVPIRGNEPSPPRLDRDGFEFVEQLNTPATHSRRQDEPRTNSQFRIPHTAHDRISYNLGYQEHTATPLPNFATNARSTTHSGHAYSNSQYHLHHPHENRAVESYEIVEVHDPNGDYVIRRPRLVQHNPQEGIHEYENHSHPYATRYPNGGRYMNKNSRLDHEEYDPRFPAVGGASYTR